MPGTTSSISGSHTTAPRTTDPMTIGSSTTDPMITGSSTTEQRITGPGTAEPMVTTTPVTMPSIDTCRDAVEMAVRAPSVHNTQPWRWRIEPGRVDLFADFDRQVPSTDPRARALLVSCGAALHHLDVAFAMLGWRAVVDRMPDPDRTDHLATVTLVPHTPSDIDIRMAAAIHLRQSDRRRYAGRPVPARDLRAVSQVASRFGAAARLVPDLLLSHLADPMQRAAARHARDEDYLAELERWTCAPGATAGVPARNAPRARRDGELPVRLFAETQLSEYTDDPDSANWLVVCTPHDNRLSQLRAGEATSAMLLQATYLGLATSIQSEPLGMLDLRDEIRGTLLQDCAYPHVMIRLGRMPHAAAPLESTPRRPLGEVVELA
ncbi:Acg family FMN-binding oxidoreductase [Nocardia halotolerans]|uniref:Acg family FMN-binding oxidoreductase n=1 Tax=Nocardia halotolerans TaxID=1755878 RepID=A0ABV8VQE3_9NOCA